MPLTKQTVFGALALAFVSGGLSAIAPAHAGTTNFSNAKYQQYKSSGRAFMLDFSATWCPTCRAQHRVISGLQKSSPALKKIPILRVDWDKYRDKPIAKSLRIPRQSTLVMFKGGREVGRLIAQTGKTSIKTLMQRGL